MRVRNALRPFAIAVLMSALLLGVGSAAAASGGATTGSGAGGGQMVRAASASASTPPCTIQWRFSFTRFLPDGPINWNWHSTVGCNGTKTLALYTRASLYLGSQRSGATPIATCQHCAFETLHGFKSIPFTGGFNGAGSWFEKTHDFFTVPNIGTNTANGSIVWTFTNGTGNCTEVNADEVECTTTSDAVVVP
jgi:hypothetical protein